MNQTALLDLDFLLALDRERNRVTYARVTSLTLDNYPIDRIEGVVTAGSITLDGDSAVRRICSLSLTTGNFNILNVYWSLATRVKIEIGIQNHLLEYQDKYDEIIWFNQGVYVLTDFSTSAQVNNYTIQLSGKDKMCLLNGDVGGTFNAETYIDTERIQQEDGTWVDEKRPVAYIIREMVHHYAQESFHNIIIKDIDTLSLKVLNNKKATFYLIQTCDTEEIIDLFYSDLYADTPSTLKQKYYYKKDVSQEVDFNNIATDFYFKEDIDEDDIGLISTSDSNYEPSIIVDEKSNQYYVIKIEYGDDIGYQLTETYYPEELIAGIGETVTSVLDKIVETFGAYEYFYNLDGQFVFQAKQTYVNTSWDNRVTIERESYIAPSMVSSQVQYTFEGNELTTAYSNSPALGDIKNDFTVWGLKKNSSGVETPIHMRYAIDLKPTYYWSYNNIGYISTDFYKDEIYNGEKSKKNKMSSTVKVNDYPFPSVTMQTNNGKEKYFIVDWREIIYQMALDYYQHNHDDDFEVRIQVNNNKVFYKNIFDKNNTFVRTEAVEYRLYERGHTGYEQYYHDIEGFWRLLYAPKDFLDEYTEDQSKYPLYSVNVEDFYDTIVNTVTGASTLGEYIGPWNKNIVLAPSSLLFWFDFFDANDLGLGQFSVPAIGSRPKEEENDSIRVLIYKDIPDIIFITREEYDFYNAEHRLLDGYDYFILDEYDYIAKAIEDDKIRLSSRSVTAQEKIDDLLYNYAYCNETINITSVPIYYLEPNTIISAEDEQRKVNGYYIMNKINLPLDYKGTMQITAIKVPERVY